MFSGFFRELKEQIVMLGEIIRSRDFWIYVAVILVMLLLAFAGFRLASGFDPLARSQLRLDFSCRTGEGQLATIIIGAFAFAMACLFTLGEVINWVEEKRMSQAPGRHPYKIGFWRPILHILGTLFLGVGGYVLMRTWCT